MTEKMTGKMTGNSKGNMTGKLTGIVTGKLTFIWLIFALIGMTGASIDPPESHLEWDGIDTGVETRWMANPQKKISKKDLEFNQYVPAFRLRGEPSCEELRAMWRMSKREARRATSTNYLPRTRPYSYGRMVSFAPSHHQRPFVYGEPRHFVHSTASFASPIKGSFNRLRNMLGINAGVNPGAYQRIREMVKGQRKPGETSKGKLKELEDIVLEDINLKQDADMSKSSSFYQPMRRKLSVDDFLTEDQNSPKVTAVDDTKTADQDDDSYTYWDRLPSIGFQ